MKPSLATRGLGGGERLVLVYISRSLGRSERET
jgi:hypothetical protein